MNLEWQAFGASSEAHLIDPSAKATKRSGYRAACGRYAGVRFEAWMAINAIEVWAQSLPLGAFRCVHCATTLKEGDRAVPAIVDQRGEKR
jgi:hypothetical protein